MHLLSTRCMPRLSSEPCVPSARSRDVPGLGAAPGPKPTLRVQEVVLEKNGRLDVFPRSSPGAGRAVGLRDLCTRPGRTTEAGVSPSLGTQPGGPPRSVLHLTGRVFGGKRSPRPESPAALWGSPVFSGTLAHGGVPQAAVLMCFGSLGLRAGVQGLLGAGALALDHLH